MRITLEVVRKVLRNGLGYQCFAAGFIREVREDPHIPTACITREGRLHYNPAFLERYVGAPEDLFALLLHELLHPLWAHFLHSPGMLENLAADAVINAAITTLYPQASHQGHLFRAAYEPEGLGGLLRPGSHLEEGYERAVVITDGYARLSESLRQELLRGKVQLLTVLFGHARGCPPLEPLGEVVRLEEVCG